MNQSNDLASKKLIEELGLKEVSFLKKCGLYFVNCIQYFLMIVVLFNLCMFLAITVMPTFGGYLVRVIGLQSTESLLDILNFYAFPMLVFFGFMFIGVFFFIKGFWSLLIVLLTPVRNLICGGVYYNCSYFKPSSIFKKQVNHKKKGVVN